MSSQDNINIISAWIDAHNRRDMKALDYMDEDVEIVVSTGVTHRGLDVMRKLAETAYSGGVWKDITNILPLKTKRASSTLLKAICQNR